MHIFHLNGGPTNQPTNEYLIPLVTGVTLWRVKEGNTITEPILLNYGIEITCSVFAYEQN